MQETAMEAHGSHKQTAGHKTEPQPATNHDKHGSMPAMHYRNLGLMLLLSFVAMYILVYAMVDRFANVYNSVNQAYMAGLMTAPMLVIELLVMRAMYPDKKLNALLLGAGVASGVVCWVLIRQQAAVGDQQFLRSMIPHHAGAVLMCEQNHLRDPELQALCGRILASQQAEIELMEGKLE
jgi:uncharacterized protein (DUF305 family)